MGRRARLLGTTLRRRPLEQKAQAVQEFGQHVVPQLGAGRLTAVVDRVFDLAQAADALDHLRVPGKFGKLLLATGDA
jgi:NADPH:quinone reductase-like Zn-dependent oxidoreductase